MSNRATLHWPCGDTQGLSVLQPRQPHRSALTGQTPVGCRGNPGGCLGQGHEHRNRNVARWSAGFVGGLVCGFFGCFARPGLAGMGLASFPASLRPATLAASPVVPGGLFGLGPGRLWRVSHCRQRPGPMPDCLYQLLRLPWLGRHFEVGLSAPRFSSSLR